MAPAARQQNWQEQPRRRHAPWLAAVARRTFTRAFAPASAKLCGNILRNMLFRHGARRRAIVLVKVDG
jgi:hypothetical protein